MPIASVKEMIEAGVHFGSAASRWNPKMKPYIHSKQAKIHIIDLRETVKGLVRSYHFLRTIAANGQKVLFVGTKRQAADVIRQEATRAESFFVANRWLGGTLTNMNTMRHRINRLQELEALEASGQLEEYNKKMISSLTRERKKIFRNFEGIRSMHELPGAIVVVDPGAEHICIAESVKLGIPLIGVVDTDDDPEKLDFVIPANDDALRSVQYLISRLADAVIEGKKSAATQGTMRNRAEGGSGGKGDEGKKPNAPDDFTQLGGFSFGGDGKE